MGVGSSCGATAGGILLQFGGRGLQRVGLVDDPGAGQKLSTSGSTGREVGHL